MDDVMKVVVPDSASEENEICVCKRCGEVHDMKNIEKCRRIRREQSRCHRCGLEPPNDGFDLNFGPQGAATCKWSCVLILYFFLQEFLSYYRFE
jgi:hypothetical protein